MLKIDLIKKLHSVQGEMILNVQMNFDEGQFVCVYGKSGAGKTTLLKMLAGIVEPNVGEIIMGENVWYHAQHKINLAPQKREIGFVFQDFALFPNMTVEENLRFVLSDKKNKKEIIELLEVTDLLGLKDVSVTKLSGGQQQRVALARALVRKPKLLLLDEPLSALDFEMRYKLQDELIKLHKHFKLTTIMISHETSEIYRLADKVFQLNNGKIVQEGNPDILFHHNDISGKVQITGQLVSLTPSDLIFVARILSGNQIMNVVLSSNEAKDLVVGERVLVVAKAFNPSVLKYKNS